MSYVIGDIYGLRAYNQSLELEKRQIGEYLGSVHIKDEVKLRGNGPYLIQKEGSSDKYVVVRKIEDADGLLQGWDVYIGYTVEPIGFLPGGDGDRDLLIESNVSPDHIEEVVKKLLD